MAKVVTAYMTGDTPSEAIKGFVWGDQDEAAEFARAEGDRFVYEAKFNVYAEDLTVSNDMDEAGD